MKNQIQILDGAIDVYGCRHPNNPYRAINDDGTVDGFTVVVRDTMAHIVGQVDVIKTVFGFYETHSLLNKIWHGHGLGIEMYAAAFDEAFKRGFDIRSSLSPTSDARSVWCSRRLRERYTIRKVGNRYRVLERR